MALLNNICTPALIYLIFALSQIIIDTFKRAYNIAFVKFIQMVVFTLMLNLLCSRNLTWVSWLIIAVPFLFMGFMTILLLYVLKLDNRSSEVIEEDEKGEENDDLRVGVRRGVRGDLVERERRNLLDADEPAWTSSGQAARAQGASRKVLASAGTSG